MACASTPAPSDVELCEPGLRCVAGDVWRCGDDGFLTQHEVCDLDAAVCVEGACLPGHVSLVEPEAWRVAEEEDDPFWAERPSGTEPCVEFWTEVEDSAPVIDGQWFKLDTSACNYLTATQPLLEDVKKGDTLEVLMHHYAIIFGEGSYKLAVQIGDSETVAWSKMTSSVPLAQTWIQETFSAPVAAPAGTPIYWHVENHGKNEWSVFDIRKKH